MKFVEDMNGQRKKIYNKKRLVLKIYKNLAVNQILLGTHRNVKCVGRVYILVK